MPKGKKRMTIQGLVPNEEYVIQVRAVDDGEGSVWSPKEKITTIDDTAGGTRTPAKVELTSFVINAEGRFSADWNSVKANTDGTELVVLRYEILLTSVYGQAIAPYYGTSGETQNHQFSFPAIKALFAGNLPGELTANVRAVNSAGTEGEWSEPITAILPIPYRPTMPPEPPPAAEGVVDGIKVRWDIPAEPYVPGDPRWPAGYRVYMGNTADFVPDVAGKSNMMFQGPTLEYAYTTMSYEIDHYFKVASYSNADLQSDYITMGPARPVSPYGPDDTPPLAPVLAQPTFNADRSVSGQANLSWTFDANVEVNKDVNGFVVAWRLQGEKIGGQDIWRNTYFASDARSGVIDLPRAFANYEFKIAAYDFVANYSDYSATKLLEGAGDPPGALTGVDGIPRWDGIKLVWNHSESQAVINGGKYEVQFNATGTFDNDIADYATGNRELDLTGHGGSLFPPQSTWYWRVRAVDVMGRSGPWSAVQTEVLPAFPTASASDGQQPSSAPTNVKVTGGLNYLNVSWDRVPNTDPVTYEVYLSTTSGFTPDATNYAGSTPATSLMVNSTSAIPTLQQNTPYYVKIRATDADTKPADPKFYSTPVSGQLTQIAGGDLGINVSGENLLYNTSFETDSGTISPPSANQDGLADYWNVVNGNLSTTPVTTSLPANGRTGGKAQRISWTGNTTGIAKGITTYNQGGIVRPNTEYTISFYARAGVSGTGSAGTGFNINMSPAPAVAVAHLHGATGVPALDSSVWKRYMYKFTTGATVDPNGFSVEIIGHTGSTGGWIEFDDIQLEAGNIASAYKVGTVSIAKLASGRMETAELIIDKNGIIKSDDYNASTRRGYAITKDGIDLFEGKVNAAILEANSTITNKLFVGSDLEIATGGKFYSTNYRPAGTNGASDPGAGFRMDSAGFDMRSGTVAFGTLSAGTMTTGGLKIGAGGEIVIDSTGAIRSNVYSQGTTGWKISSTGIEMWDTNSKINVAALETGTLSSAIVTIGSGGEIRSANWHDTNKTGWRINDQGFTMYNGTIYGSSVQTNQLKSIKVDPATGLYTFSINTDGYAELAGALVYGNMRVGTGASNVIQSGTWNGSNTGWQIRGDGWAQFFHVNTWNMNIYEGATVGNSSAHHLKSGNFVSSADGYGGAGWLIRGDGYAEFNGGSFRLGSAAAGRTLLIQDATGNGQLRFYAPGRNDGYHHLKMVGTVFHMRGGWGGAIEMHPNGGNGTTVVLSQNINVTQHAYIDNNVNCGSLDVRSGVTISGHLLANAGLRANSTPGGGGALVRINNDGWLRRDTSSRRYKHSIEPYSPDPAAVMQLEPKRFKFNADGEDAEFVVGFIAEEADELGLTDLVYYAEHEGEVVPESFAYEKYAVALQTVIKQQQEQIAALESRLSKLERRS